MKKRKWKKYTFEFLTSITKQLVMKKICAYSLICLLFLSVKCEDTEEDYLPAGIETRVFGSIFDDFNNLPVPNQKLIVGEFQRDFRFDGGAFDVFVQELDFTISDVNGNFDFIFETGGMGTKYKIYPRQNPSIWIGSDVPKEIENIGDEQQTDFNYIILGKCTLRITLENVDFSPLVISIFSSQNYEVEDINQSNGIVERDVYLFSDSDETLTIFRTLDDGTLQTATFLVPANDSLDDRIFDIILTNEDFE